jgi:beta-glucosidase
MELNRIKKLIGLCLITLISAAVNLCGADVNAADIEQRAKSLLSQMTLEEKIDYIGGYKDFYIRGIERLGIPQVVMADGPAGCRNYGKTTAYPAAIGLAASWNRDLANQFGKAIGRDCRARGVHVLLMPGVNIYRSPLCGRNFEYMGEDPYLAGNMAVPVIKGVQSQNVIATVKHYAGNNQEYDRHNISSDIDERTLHEIYLPAFKYAVQEGKVCAVMNSYNLINGIHASQHNYLNNEILKGLWGFDGILMSDWVSTYDAIGAANGGLDLEMPSGKYMNRENLIPAIEAGKVSVATIDDKVLRILKTLIKMGFFDRPQKDETIPLDDPSSAKAALQMAREGIVLLKNDNNVLPLNRDEVKSIAVFGANANMKNNVHGGGGSSYTTPFHIVNAVDAVKAISGGKFEVLAGDDKTVKTKVFNFDDFEITGGGLDCKIYAYKDEYREKEPASVEPAAKRKHSKISFSAKEKNFDADVNDFTALWAGTIKPKKTGVYRLNTDVKGRLRYVLLNDEPVFRAAGGQKNINLYLEKGKKYAIQFYFAFSSPKNDWVIRLGLDFVADFDSYANVEAMKKADAVVICTGFNSDTEYEGGDRAYELPLLEEMLIKRASQVNKNTIVALTAGGSVATKGWIDNVNVLIHNWYPGQNGATALAEIIFGQTNPSGKLPMTFEKQLADSPTFNSYHDSDGDKHVKYTEGIFVGYRGFEKTNTKPLFPFGYGLSYTKFEYSNMKITSAGDKTEVSCDIKNAGGMAGAEVVQLYISDVKCSVERPVKELKGFEKVLLAPGETKTVKFNIGKDAFSFYYAEKHQWKAEPGEFKVLLGSSSADIRLQDKFEFKG